jgi:Zn-dependent M28 family amino/carboxypeptidase
MIPSACRTAAFSSRVPPTEFVSSVAFRTAVCLCLASAAACQTTVVPAPVAATGMDADIAYLASPALNGRETGTPGADSAAAFLARRYSQLRLPAAFLRTCPDSLPCRSYFQFFRANGRTSQNVAAIVDGTDSVLRNQYVVIGAHFDHLGRSSPSSLDRSTSDALHPGADDNASGTAATLELARRLAERPTRRSVLVVNFDAEEIGLVGSRVFVDHPPMPLGSIALMVNLDMVGRLRDDHLFADDPQRNSRLRRQLEEAARAQGLKIEWTSEIDGRSDHASFAAERVPSVALFTGFHYDYHRASDTPTRINSVGLRRVVDFAETLVRGVADR